MVLNCFTVLADPYRILFVLRTEITAVAVNIRFFTLKQGGGHAAVVDIGRCGLDRMDETTFRIHSNMFLVTEVPLVPFFT